MSHRYQVYVPADYSHARRWPAIVVFPQAPPEHRWHGQVAHLALAALDRALQEFTTDADRVYLVGISAGGNGVWNLAYRYPERFAALVAICGWVMPTAERREAILPADGGPPYAGIARRIRSLPTWIWHGSADGVVPVEESRRMAHALRVGGAEVTYTELPGVGHDAWTAAFDSPELPRWLFTQNRRDR